MSTKRKYSVRVAVFKGEPMDFSKYRHAGLSFVPDDGSSQYFFHVRGFTGNFKFEERKDFDPITSATFVKEVQLGDARFSVTSAQLAAFATSVLVNNEDPEFNCQQWVEHALLALFRNFEYITEGQYNDGVNGMIAATMEAEDEHIA